MSVRVASASLWGFLETSTPQVVTNPWDPVLGLNALPCGHWYLNLDVSGGTYGAVPLSLWGSFRAPLM